MINNYKNNKDRFIQILLSVLILCFILIFINLTSWLLIPTEKLFDNTNIQPLNISSLEFVVDKMNQRQDINTNGKPNTDKFNFGNQEPF
jgi:hypothetical protein